MIVLARYAEASLCGGASEGGGRNGQQSAAGYPVSAMPELPGVGYLQPNQLQPNQQPVPMPQSQEPQQPPPAKAARYGSAFMGGRADSPHPTPSASLLPKRKAKRPRNPPSPLSKAPEVALVAKGLRLHLSSSSTGYRGVYEHSSGSFRAERCADGRRVFIGLYDTAVEAAVAYARAPVKTRVAVATDAGGLRLHLSSSSNTGYKGVREKAPGCFYATRQDEYLGAFDSAVEAAVAYARAVVEAPEAAMVA